MIRLSAALAVCLVAAPARAQCRFDQWTAANGLPQNSVRDVLQTRDGYIWFTTFDGLVRFDGVRFTVFNRSNSPGLGGNRFLSLFEDDHGDLWAGLETGEVARRHEGRFTTYGPAHGLPAVINPRVSGDGRGGVVVHYLRSEADEETVRYWDDVYPFSAGRFLRAEALGATLPPLASGRDRDIALEWRPFEGEYWRVSTRDVLRRSGDGSIRAFGQENGLPGTRPVVVWGKGRPVQVASRDAADRVWITDLESMKSEPLCSKAPDGFDSQFGYQDREGNIWFSTNGSGLYRARRNIVTPFGRSTGLGFGESYAILEARDGSLWIGTAGSGLYRSSDGAFGQVASEREEALAWTGGVVTSLFEDRAGRLWVNGFWRFLDGRLVRDPGPETSRRWLASAAWSMAEDGAGARWVGTLDGVLRVRNGEYEHFTTKDGLAGNDTKVIIEDGSGGLWLGGTGGVTHYRDGRFTAWTVKDGLPGDNVRALHLDGAGALWIGTYDSGLGRLKDGRFTRYTTRDGLFDDGVFQILDDGLGWFWMSCNRGIYRVRKSELEDFAAGRAKLVNSHAYNESDGMPSTECNGGRWPAGVKTRDGKLWFPTMGGLAMIDPATVRVNPQPPPVVIEAMRIERRTVEVDLWQAALGGGAGAAPIRILPGQDSFEIDYTALSFINSENLRFRYRLEGADHDWVESGTRRTAYYSRVPPGAYTFRVIAANSDGAWNTAGASVPITVVPHFTQTQEFRSLGALFALGVVAAAWSYRVAQLRQAQAAQQEFARELIRSQEHERKRIAAELHDSLGQELLVIKNRAQFGQAAAREHPEVARDYPEILSQLESIASSAARSLDEVRAISQNLRPYHLDRLGLTKALEVMIENVAATTGVQFLADLAPLDDAFQKEEAITLYRIVQEGLNNIVKHSGASEAIVTLEREADAVTLRIRDNGKGFPPETASRRSGFGLAGMGERARMLGAELKVDSVEGKGTTLTLRVRLPVAGGGSVS